MSVCLLVRLFSATVDGLLFSELVDSVFSCLACISCGVVEIRSLFSLFVCSCVCLFASVADFSCHFFISGRIWQE